MTILRIEKGALPSSVMVPASKSYANRALILSAVHNNESQITNVPEATDVIHLIDALKAAGLSLTVKADTVTIHDSFPACEKGGAEIPVGEGGTTARFLAAMLLLGKRKYVLRLGKRLKIRPWDEFLSIAHKLGCRAELKDDLLTLQGPLQAPSKLEVDCSRTTQFATAFDLVLPETEVVPLNLHASESYWKMNAPLKAHFKTRNEYFVPGDWSSAAFPMAFAALNHEIHFPGLKADDFQADSKILSVLRKLGSVDEKTEGITITPVKTSVPISLDMSDCLDLFPALSFLLAHVEGEHHLTGLANLLHKESDRLSEIIKILDVFDRKYVAGKDSIMIRGSKKICAAAELVLPDDHRIVMTAALFLRHHNGGSVSNAESVNKSYPGFFQLMK